MHLLKTSGKFMCHIQRTYVTGQSQRPCNSWPEWQQPEGHDTGIKVYNFARKTKVPLVTQHPGTIKWYVCGPTVYDSAHIGHGLTYVRFDIIRRILEDYFKLNVVQVTGITDVDDKIINKAKYFKVSISDVSRYFEAEFFRDMAMLGVTPPHLYTRVTDYIEHIVQFVQNIIDAGYAYKVADGSVFFNNVAYRRARGLELPVEFESVQLQRVAAAVKEGTTKAGTTAASDDVMSEQLLTALQASAIDDDTVPGKRHPIDFALWKSSKEGDPSWPSPFGEGRPGWHIECSAMASAMFGSSLDVHSGGIDLRFPHHYCEEAQSCARHGASMWTNYWWHSGHLTIDREKMSKSIGNVITIPELLETHSPDTFRQFVLSSHYTKPVTYRDTTLELASIQVTKTQQMLDACQHFMDNSSIHYNSPDVMGITGAIDDDPSSSCDAHPLLKELTQTKKAVESSLRADFNTPEALRHLMALMSVTNTYLNLSPQGTDDSQREAFIDPITDDTINEEDGQNNNSHNNCAEDGSSQSNLLSKAKLSQEKNVVQNESSLSVAEKNTVCRLNIASSLHRSNASSQSIIQSDVNISSDSFSNKDNMDLEISSSRKASSFRASEKLRPVGRFEVTLVRNYIMDMMTIFGMNYKDKKSINVITPTTDERSGIDAKFGDIMKALLNFRQNVRDFALLKNGNNDQENKLSKSDKKRLREERNPLLGACDLLREQLAGASVIVKDQKDGASWTISDNISTKKKQSEEKKP